MKTVLAVVIFQEMDSVSNDEGMDCNNEKYFVKNGRSFKKLLESTGIAWLAQPYRPRSHKQPVVWICTINFSSTGIYSRFSTSCHSRSPMSTENLSICSICSRLGLFERFTLRAKLSLTGALKEIKSKVSNHSHKFVILRM